MPTVYPGAAANDVLGRVFAITLATNATPIVVTTDNPHGYSTGDQVVVQSVGGNTAANQPWVPWTITVVDTTRFALNGSVGNGAYTSGGTVYSIANEPPIQLPSDADGFTVSSLNVGLQGLADRTAYLASQLSAAGVPWQLFAGGVSDDTFGVTWASETPGNTNWGQVTLSSVGVGDILAFNTTSPAVAVNHGDKIWVDWEIGDVQTATQTVLFSVALQLSSVASNALVQATGGAKAVPPLSTVMPLTGTTAFTVSAAGSAASITAAGGGTVTFTGLAGMSAQSVGDTIVVSGAASAGNNGAFTIASYISATSVTATNAAGVAPDANNGAIAWRINNMKIGSIQIQRKATTNTASYVLVGHRAMRVAIYRTQIPALLDPHRA